MRISSTSNASFGWNEAIKATQRRLQQGAQSTENTASSDSVSFSSLLNGASLLPGTNTASGSISIDDIRQCVQEETASFRATLYQRMKTAGVDTSREIQLQTDRTGHVRVMNGHPDAEQIESIINDSELANQFRGISAHSSLLHACERGEAFRKAYAVDPQAAVAQYSYLFAGNTTETFSLFLTEEGAKTHFDTVFS